MPSRPQEDYLAAVSYVGQLYVIILDAGKSIWKPYHRRGIFGGGCEKGLPESCQATMFTSQYDLARDHQYRRRRGSQELMLTL